MHIRDTCVIAPFGHLSSLFYIYLNRVFVFVLVLVLYVLFLLIIQVYNYAHQLHAYYMCNLLTNIHIYIYILCVIAVAKPSLIISFFILPFQSTKLSTVRSRKIVFS